MSPLWLPHTAADGDAGHEHARTSRSLGASTGPTSSTERDRGTSARFNTALEAMRGTRVAWVCACGAGCSLRIRSVMPFPFGLRRTSPRTTASSALARRSPRRATGTACEGFGNVDEIRTPAVRPSCTYAQLLVRGNGHAEARDDDTYGNPPRVRHERLTRRVTARVSGDDDPRQRDGDVEPGVCVHELALPLLAPLTLSLQVGAAGKETLASAGRQPASQLCLREWEVRARAGRRTVSTAPLAGRGRGWTEPSSACAFRHVESFSRIYRPVEHSDIAFTHDGFTNREHDSTSFSPPTPAEQGSRHG